MRSEALGAAGAFTGSRAATSVVVGIHSCEATHLLLELSEQFFLVTWAQVAEIVLGQLLKPLETRGKTRIINQTFLHLLLLASSHLR